MGDTEGGTHVIIPQEDNDNKTGRDNGDRAGELAPAVPMPSNDVQTSRGNAQSSSNQDSGVGAVRDRLKEATLDHLLTKIPAWGLVRDRLQEATLDHLLTKIMVRGLVRDPA